MKAPFGYMGGKQKLAPQIMPFLPDHKIYVEPFFGSGAVFFEKGYKDVSNSIAYREVIGDLDGNVTNFFEQLRNHAEEMEERLSLFEYSEAMCAKCKTNSEAFLSASDLDRACMYFFNACSSFGGKINGGFAYGAIGQNNCQKFKSKRKDLLKFAERLTDCYIFNKSYDVLIDRFDSKDTFFYFDPPYKDTTKYTVQKENSFSYEDFDAKVKSTKGKWIISHYRDEWLEETFSGYRIYDLQHYASICKSLNEDGTRQGKDVKECIVMNYDPDGVMLWNGERGLFSEGE